MRKTESKYNQEILNEMKNAFIYLFVNQHQNNRLITRVSFALKFPLL